MWNFSWTKFCKIGWNHLVKQFNAKIGEQFDDKNLVNNLIEHSCWIFGKKVGQKLAGKIRWNNWAKKLSGKSLQCTMYSKVLLLSLLGSPIVPQFVKGALMLLSLGSETLCQAPTLLHPSRGDGSNYPKKWSQLSGKVVLIVWQSLFCRTI